jgi:3'-phosphoadenosine 5'-phosphosulfate sulfotransferase (PAPS reductase)/FAD synthetase
MIAEDIIDDAFERHEYVALMFSGGKDSLALLELTRPYWSRTPFIWVDTGATLPEIRALMVKVQEAVPYFLVVHSDQPRQIAAHGHPVDTLPVWHTSLGQSIGGPQSIKLQSWADCCNSNLWQPSWDYLKSLGLKAVFRGQRNDDRLRAPTRSGDVLDGVELIYPIQDWSTEQVLQLLDDAGWNDERLQLDHSSLDCWSCTAFIGKTNDRLEYLRKHHPDKARQVYRTLKEIRVVLQEQIDTLTHTIMEAVDG